ncbi:MAG: element excision factor XisI family protein [Bacteroidota bacterium]
MDKALKNKEIVKEIQRETFEWSENNPDKSIQQFLVVDDENGQYLLYMEGWRKQDHIYGCFFHIHVTTKGKVWLFRDGTDLEIGQQLVDKGIAREDIVLGWISPIRREDTAFAVA